MATTAQKLNYAEVSAPSTPASGLVVTYAKSDGKMYSKDDAGTETLMSAGSAGIPATILDAKGDIIAASAADTAAKVTAGADGTGLIYRAGATAGIEPVEILPWTIFVDVFPTAILATNWDTLTVDDVYINNGIKNSSGAQNAEIGWDLILAKGTWDAELISYTDSNRGIYTLRFDGVDKGTIDGYSASAVRVVRSSITGVTTSTSGKVRVSLKMATKNASSSSYFGSIQGLRLQRTA